MEFVEHSIAWAKGEIFEGRLIFISGIVILILAILFYKVGTTPNAKAMLYPLLVIAIMFIGIGLTMNYSNANRIAEFQKAYSENPGDFIQAEKERVEGFQYMYTITLIIASVSFAFALLVFWFSNSPTMKAVAIAVALFGISGLVIDHFSEERAGAYYQKIEEAIK